MTYWHIFVEGRDARYKHLGRVQGETLENAIINGMMEDHQFKTDVREFIGSEEIPSVEFTGVPSNQLRTTTMDADRLTEGHQ